MAFTKVKGKTYFRWLPVTVSTAIAEGALVAFSSGYLIAATSSTAPTAIAGRLVKAITATDSDYATARLVCVEVPAEPGVEWVGDAASLAATSVGSFYDLTDSVTVNGGASTYDVAQLVKYISATKGHFILNIGAYGPGVIS